MRAHTEDLESAAQRAQVPEMRDLWNENEFRHCGRNYEFSCGICAEPPSSKPERFMEIASSFLSSVKSTPELWVPLRLCQTKIMHKPSLLPAPAAACFLTAADYFDVVFNSVLWWRVKTKTRCPKKCINTHDLRDLWVTVWRSTGKPWNKCFCTPVL